MLGIVDATSSYMAIAKAISLFYIESAVRERLIAVRPALSAISWNGTPVDDGCRGTACLGRARVRPRMLNSMMCLAMTS